MNFSVTEQKKIYFADVEATDNWMFLIQIEAICPHIKYWCSLYDDKCGSRHTNQPKNASATTRWHTEKHRRNMHSIRNTKRSLIVFAVRLIYRQCAFFCGNKYALEYCCTFLKVCLRIAVGRFVQRYSNLENFVVNVKLSRRRLKNKCSYRLVISFWYARLWTNETGLKVVIRKEYSKLISLWVLIRVKTTMTIDGSSLKTKLCLQNQLPVPKLSKTHHAMSGHIFLIFIYF